MCLLVLVVLFLVAGIERIVKGETKAVVLGIFYVLCAVAIGAFVLYGTLTSPQTNVDA